MIEGAIEASGILKVSVIIPTHNRAQSLKSTLQLLSSQTLPLDQFEVIVVDDGSTDDTASVQNDPFPFALNYIHQFNRGSAPARNEGARYARGDTLVFIDDDISLEPNYLQGIVAAREGQNRIIVRGTVLSYRMPEDTPFRALYARLTVDQIMPKCEPFFLDFASNNFAIRREDFFALGQWEEGIAYGGQSLWLDVDLAYRAFQQGYEFRQSAEARCYHRDYAIHDLSTYARRLEMQSRLVTLLFRKHPELECLIPMYRDKTRIVWQGDPPLMIMRKLLRRVSAWGLAPRILEVLVSMLETAWPVEALLSPLYRWIVGAYIYRGYHQGLREMLEKVP